MSFSGWIQRLIGAAPAPAAPSPAPAAAPKAPPGPVRNLEEEAAAHSRRGVEALEQGRFLDACDAFRAVVALNPDSAANHVNLAYALIAAGSDSDALRHLRRATALDANSFDAHYLLAGTMERRGEQAGAIEALQRALALRPDYEPVHADLCRVFALSGDVPAARAAIQAALVLNPDSADFHHYLGNLSMVEEDPFTAIEHYDRAIALKPDFAEACANLGLALHSARRLDDAVASLQRAIQLEPSSGDFHAKLGIAFKAQKKMVDAERELTRALELKPDDPEFMNNLGMVLAERGRLDEAMTHYRRAIELRPDLPGGYANLGLALYESLRVPQAIEVYRAGLKVKPVAELHDNLAIALQKSGAVDEAIEHFHAALALRPNNLNTQSNLAGALAEGGGPKEAIAAYRHILELHPKHLVAYSNLLFNLSVDDGTSTEQYLAEALKYNAQLNHEPLPAVAVSPLAGRRLRVGFVSADLRTHPVGFFLEGILNSLPADRLELFAYATAPHDDALSARIKPLFAAWRMLRGLNDDVAARLIRDDEIDILIDLSGHTGGTRLPVFAYRPAPVQITWLGYFATTGVAEVDYVLADEVCVPAGREGDFTEKVWRLPRTRLCYTPPSDEGAPPVAPLPALSNVHVTFGCFQRLNKLTDAVLALWGRVFAALPTARLLLQTSQVNRPKYREMILKRLAAVGISADRVTARGYSQRGAYLQAYGEVDFVLDTFPFTGGTTTCEALWMGVPTLTLTGDSMIARQGVAMMTAAGLPDWIAQTQDDYVAKAVAFASDLQSLASLRAGMRERVVKSPLFDVQLFATHLEAALRGIWELEHAKAEATAGASGP